MRIEHDKLSLLLIILFVIFATSAFILSFFKYIYLKDYTIEFRTECNPETNTCFKQSCSEDDPRCFGKSTYYYKVVIKKGNTDMNASECLKDQSCKEIYCNDENISLYSSEESCS